MTTRSSATQSDERGLDDTRGAMGAMAFVWWSMNKAEQIQFEYRLLDQSEIYTEDAPQALDIDETSEEWLRLIDAEFEIYVDGDLFYDGEIFPIAEFVYNIYKWSQKDMPADKGYSFDDSMNFEDQKGVITIDREEDGWRISTLWEEVPGGVLISKEVFETSLLKFVDSVIEDIKGKWGVDLRKIKYHAYC